MAPSRPFEVTHLILADTGREAPTLYRLMLYGKSLFREEEWATETAADWTLNTLGGLLWRGEPTGEHLPNASLHFYALAHNPGMRKWLRVIQKLEERNAQLRQELEHARALLDCHSFGDDEADLMRLMRQGIPEQYHRHVQSLLRLAHHQGRVLERTHYLPAMIIMKDGIIVKDGRDLV